MHSSDDSARVLIICEGCGAIHKLALPVCPVCGRCPSCGQRRVSTEELRRSQNCSVCNAPHCEGCGRCHLCGAIRFTEMEPCGCGFPDDPEVVRSVEKTFQLKEVKPGCVVLPVALLAIITATLVVTWKLCHTFA